MTVALRTYPLDAAGSAQGAPKVTGPVSLTDFTAAPRFGLKGNGTVAFLKAQNIAVPEVNCCAGDPLVLRLGREEAVVLSDPLVPQGQENLRRAWNDAANPKGYDAWREETWAWMHLAGPHIFDLMAKISPVDLRDGQFRKGQIAQTRVGYVEAITFRTDRLGEAGFDVLFDIAATAFFANAVATAAAEFY